VEFLLVLIQRGNSSQIEFFNICPFGNEWLSCAQRQTVVRTFAASFRQCQEFSGMSSSVLVPGLILRRGSLLSIRGWDLGITFSVLNIGMQPERCSR
jgi:hypothetical protein